MTDADLYLTAARAYCRAKFPYGGDTPETHYADGAAGARRHVEYDARSTAAEPWLRAVVEAVTSAGAGRVDAGRSPGEREPMAGEEVDASAPKKYVTLAVRITAGVVIAAIVVPVLTVVVCGSIWVTVKLVRATGGLF